MRNRWLQTDIEGGGNEILRVNQQTKNGDGLLKWSGEQRNAKALAKGERTVARRHAFN